MRWLAVVGLVGWILVSAEPSRRVLHAQATFTPTCPVDMRLLVIAADGTEPVLSAIRQTLDYLGTPYSIYVAAQHPGGLTANLLSDGCHGAYQGVILTTGELGYLAPSGIFLRASTGRPVADDLGQFIPSESVR